MCTPTDRALAIEELEELRTQIRKWRSKLMNSWFSDTPFMKTILLEMKETTE